MSEKEESYKYEGLRVVFGRLMTALRNRDTHLSFVGRVDPRVLEMTDGNGRTPLHRALQCDAPLELVEFLACGAATKSREEMCQAITTYTHETPLHFACYFRSSLPVVQFLVKSCPLTVNIVNNHGWTPLHHAARYGAPLEVLHFLLEQSRCCSILPSRNNRHVPIDLLPMAAADTINGVPPLIEQEVDFSTHHDCLEDAMKGGFCDLIEAIFHPTTVHFCCDAHQQQKRIMAAKRLVQKEVKSTVRRQRASGLTRACRRGSGYYPEVPNWLEAVQELSTPTMLRIIRSDSVWSLFCGGDGRSAGAGAAGSSFWALLHRLSFLNQAGRNHRPCGHDTVRGMQILARINDSSSAPDLAFILLRESPTFCKCHGSLARIPGDYSAPPLTAKRTRKRRIRHASRGPPACC